MERGTGTVPPDLTGEHDPFVTVVNISECQSPPAPQAFYQNPKYHSVLEGRKLSVQVPNEAAEECATFVTVLDVRDGGDGGPLPAAASVSKSSASSVMTSAVAAAAVPVAALTTELVTLYRLPGERLGLGLKFRGGESAHEPVQEVSVQSCAEDSPSARAACSWGRLQPGDRILAIVDRPVTALTRLECVQLLQETPLTVELRVRHAGRRETLVSQDSGISLGGEVAHSPPPRGEGGKPAAAAPAPAPAPAAPLVATNALAAEEAWIQAALESDSSCSSRSSTSTIVERGVSRMPLPPPLDLESALSQFERLERELSMDSVFAAETGEEAASLSPLPPPEVFQDPQPDSRDAEVAVGSTALTKSEVIRSRTPPAAAEEDEGFHDSAGGGGGGGTPPARPAAPERRRRRELGEASRQRRAASSEDSQPEELAVTPEESKPVMADTPMEAEEPSKETPGACSNTAAEPVRRSTEQQAELGPEQSAVMEPAPLKEDITDGGHSEETPAEGVLANYVPTPMPRKRPMMLVAADSEDESQADDRDAISPMKPPTAPPVEPKHNHPGFPDDQAAMSFEVSSAAERRRKSSAREDSLLVRHSSGETDPERPSSEDSDSERLGSSAAGKSRTSPASSPSADSAPPSGSRRCRDSSPECSPPPSDTRLPPDGHEFPPDFGDPRPDGAAPAPAPALKRPPAEEPALLRPPSGFSDGGASPSAEKGDGASDHETGKVSTLSTRGRYHRSGSLGGVGVRISDAEMVSRRAAGRERQSVEDLLKTGGRSTLGGRSPRGQISVKDKIALFSSQSVEQLAPPHPKLHKHKSLEYDLQARGTTRSQARSKSDLKLSDTEVQKPRTGEILKRRKRAAEGRGPRFGSMLNMHLSERKDTDGRNASSEDKSSEQLKPSEENSLTPQHSKPPPSHRPKRGTSESEELHPDSVTDHSERPSRHREVSPSPLSERSQSLFDLGQPEKRHSFAGLQEREYSYSGHSGNLTRKVSLNSISEERRRSLSRLRGLVIPDKVDGFTKKGPVDLPTIKSKGLSSLSSSSFRSSNTSSSSSATKQQSSSRLEKHDCHQLTSPPWKAESPNIQKYSPAFKRKNISVHSPSGSSGSAFRLVSTSSQLGGSSVELSRPSRRDLASSSPLPRDPRSASRRSEPRTTRPRLADAAEPLQRSSSLNSRPLSADGQLRRKISDDDTADLLSRLEPADADCGGSTLTLVNEPALERGEADERDDSDELELAARGRAGSIEFDHRASTSTLHDSPVKELDVEEELLRAAERLQRKASDAGQTRRPSASGDPAAGSPSPPRILDDAAWRKFAGERRPSAPPPGGETRDLAKLRQVTKASVASLKQKWQQISGDGQEAEITPARPASARSEPAEEPAVHSKFSPSPSPSPSSPSPSPSPSSDTADSPTVPLSPPADRSWPTIEKERSGFDRKLSTPSYSSSDLKLRERKDSVPSRPHSWMESERELGGYLGSPSTASSQENIMDSLDGAKSPSGSTSSLLEMLTANLKSTARSRHALSVNDLRRAFERWDGRPHGGTSGHARMSSLDSSVSEDGHGGLMMGGGSTASPTTTRDHYGSITSLASSTSLISPHELQQLIDEANQSLEESGTPSHEIIVAVIHREMMGGSIGVTLAGGADYENKEISVNKVITGSVADRDGRIKKGDRVISINGRSSKGMSHREALNTLKAPRAEVVLVLSRSRSVTPHDPGSEDGGYQRPSISAMYSRPPKILESPMDSKSLASELAVEDEFRGPPITITLKKEGAGLGFSLQGGKDSPLGDRPLVAKKIFTGGAADKSGLLHARDQILAINDQDITHMARIEAWTLLKKQPDGMVRLTIRKWLPPGPPTGPGEQPAPSAAQPADPESPQPAPSPSPAPSGAQKASTEPQSTGSGSQPATAAITRPTALPAAARSGRGGGGGGTRPVITGVTPKGGSLTPAVILPQA